MEIYSITAVLCVPPCDATKLRRLIIVYCIQHNNNSANCCSASGLITYDRFVCYGALLFTSESVCYETKNRCKIISRTRATITHQRLLHLCQRRTNSQFLICFFRYMYNQLEVMILTGRDFVGKFKET